MSQDRIKKILKEAFAGGEKAVSGVNPIIKYSDTPLVKDIIKFFEEQDDAQLINIIGNGENWQLDVRCHIEVGPNHQETRILGSQYAHSLVKDLDKYLLEEGNNVPNMSIQGIRTIDSTLEFTIGFIYAYKGNTRDLYEVNKRAKEILKDIYKNI